MFIRSVINMLEYDQKPIEIGGPGGAIYLALLVLHHSAWSTQKGMSTF